jgi:uncharacterized membrane protein (DUF2068 family)
MLRSLWNRTIFGRPLPIFLIVLWKGLSTLALLGAAVLAFVAHGHPGEHPVEIFLSRGLSAGPHNRLIYWLFEHIPYLSPKTEFLIGLGFVVWAMLFAAETVGVWLRALWGELLVIAETAAFLPFTIWRTIQHPHPLEFFTIPINLLILGYLVQAYRERKRKHEESRGWSGPQAGEGTG